MIFLYGLLIIFFSILVFLYTNFIFKKLSNNNILFKFIEFLIYYKVFFYMFLPAILRSFSGFQYEYEANVDPMEVLTIYLIETSSYIIYISVFYIFVKRFKYTTISNYYSYILEIFFVCILFLYVYFISIKAFEIFGYQFNNLFDSSLYILYPLVHTFGPVVAFFGLVYYRFGAVNNKKFILSLFAVLIYLVVSLLTGVRGLIVHPAFFLLFLLFIFGKKRYIKFIILALLSFAIFQSSFMQIRHLDNNAKLDLLSTGDIGKQKRNLINEIEWRYGEASRMSVAFLRRGLDDNFAGIQPILSSLYAPLPRSIFPEKPIPGSIGDDKYSMGMYLINSDIRGQWWNMTEFFSSAHAYWEFGIIGVVMITIISSIYISILSILFLRLGFFAIPLILLFFKPWGYNEPKIWLYEIPLQIFQYIIPGSLLLVIIIILFPLRKKLFRKVKKYEI